MKNDRIRVYLGTTGSGKTYRFAHDLVGERRVFLFDTMADPKFEHFPDESPIQPPYGVLVTELADATALACRPTSSGNFRIRMQFDDMERFDHICHIAMTLGNCTIAVDEASLFCNSNYMPPRFKQVIRLGRHKNVRVMLTTQRPPDMQALILSQAKEVYLFQMHLPNDLAYLGKFIPDIERVKNLPRGEFILWTPDQRPTETPNEPRPETSPEPLPSLPEEPLSDTLPTSNES